MDLFPRDKTVGVFRGFQQGGLEFYADLVLPYRNEFQNLPMHGQFVLVQLENPTEAVLGRISAFSAEGRLSQEEGEEFSLRVALDGSEIPEDIRERYLRYRVHIRVLGVIRKNNDSLSFIPSHRRLPHLGSRVAFPSEEVLRELAGHHLEGAPIGHLAFGEYVYAQGVQGFRRKDWMQLLSPEVQVRFSVESLVARRTFIFARAGFGKSNLNKLLFSELYRQVPTVSKRGGRKAKVGTIIFDPDGEYFWPDDKGRPGLCDVPHLQDKLVVFTNRKSPSPFYGSFVVSGVRLDIRRLSPSDVIAIALDPERQEQQNVRKLKGLDQGRWGTLVDLIHQKGNNADLNTVARLLGLDPEKQAAEATAARSNMFAIVRALHDPNSRMIDLLMMALKEGGLCVVDVSQMRGKQALILSGLILRLIFNHNQSQFTEAEPATLPTIAVVEEAQSVLGEKGSSEPYVEWVKEGRKYDLGAVLVTQQPGSIAQEILSQGDNWFIFHLLSQTDLMALKRANAHFSDDLLSSLLNEPIPGHCVFWSSVGGKPYPLSIRVLSFEEKYSVQDPEYRRESVETLALRLKRRLKEDCSLQGETFPETTGETLSRGTDYLNQLLEELAQLLKSSDEGQKLAEEGVPYGRLMQVIAENMPKEWAEDKMEWAKKNLPKILDLAYGEGTWFVKEARRKDGNTVKIVCLRRP